MKKLRVMVCGVGFGRYYIEAILRLPDMFELVGILSRGSKNSIKLAEKYSVPLMTNIEKISKENVDVACVVVKSSIVGGNGTNIVMELLEKGIHVIQEQPIHSEEYKKCLIAAKKKHCKYQLNTFYPYLDSVRKFISVGAPGGTGLPRIVIILENHHFLASQSLCERGKPLAVGSVRQGHGRLSVVLQGEHVLFSLYQIYKVGSVQHRQVKKYSLSAPAFHPLPGTVLVAPGKFLFPVLPLESGLLKETVPILI